MHVSFDLDPTKRHKMNEKYKTYPYTSEYGPFFNIFRPLNKKKTL